MQITQTGRSIIEAFEGCERAVADRPGYFTTYRDVVGVLTIGYGHTNLGNVPPPIAEGDVWTETECDAALSADLRRFEDRVIRICGPGLAPHEFDALVSFDFNTGGLDRSSIPSKIKAGRKDLVPETLGRWNKAGGKVYRGLTRRRQAEGEEFAGDVDAALATAGVHRGATDPMPQRVDRPRPPATEVTRRAKGELTTAAAGGAAAAGGQAGTTQQDKPAAPVSPAIGAAATVLGIAVVIVAIVLLIRKYRLIDAEWA
jgi:lysozyme